MPVGVLLCNAAILVGGLFGGLIRKRVSETLTKTMPVIFGLCTLAIGITALLKIEYLPVVVLSVIVGTLIGELLRLQEHVGNFFGFILEKLKLHHTLEEDEKMGEYITIVVLFCTGGAGIFGALDAGMTGDMTILISKAILDLFTAVVFAISLGYAVSLASIFQCLVLVPIFFLAQFIVPMTTNYMMGDFSAVGGLLTIAAGLKLTGAINIKLMNLLPALILVMPLSYLWDYVFTILG